jgi:hypothetical protein
MQRLWGKLLAGEVARPGSYSLHSVDFLSRMSTEDANLIARVAPFVTSGGIIKVGKDFFERHGLRFSDFLYLEDLGLMNAGFSLSLTLDTFEFNECLMSSLFIESNAIVFHLGAKSKSPKELVFEIIALTRVGRDILTLTSIPVNMEYIEEVCDYAISRGAEKAELGTRHPDGKTIFGLRTIREKTKPPPSDITPPPAPE